MPILSSLDKVKAVAFCTLHAAAAISLIIMISAKLPAREDAVLLESLEASAQLIPDQMAVNTTSPSLIITVKMQMLPQMLDFPVSKFMDDLLVVLALVGTSPH